MKKIMLLVILMFTQFLHSQSCSNITVTDIFGNTSVQLSCGTGACVELSTVVPKTFLTTSYQVSKTTYAPVIPFNQGTPLLNNVVTDDTFSDVISIPFNFCFYGGTYNKLVISPNGFITFDTTQAKLESNPNLLANNPSALLPKNSIFGVMQDLFYSDTDDSEIYYSVTGTSPCRKFVINFYKGRITGCSDAVTSQIVLSEFTNEIDIIVENKPLPCTTARFKESLIGTMNAAGNNGLSPSGRNRGVWQSGNASWKFRPTGFEVKPTIKWTNSSNVIVGNNIVLNACPTKTEKYTVTAEYFVCGTNFILSDDIDVTYNQSGSTPVINSPVNFNYTLCDNNADDMEDFSLETYLKPLITTDPTMNVRFFNTQAGAEIGGGGITGLRGGQYTIYTRVTNQSGCYSIGIVNMNITFLNKIIAKDIKKIYCFDGTQDVPVDLDSLVADMLTTPMSEITKISYYPTQGDATVPNLSAVLLPNQIITDDGDLIIANFFVRFENADGCYTVRKITIELRNPTAVQNQDICDKGNDGSENIILSNLDGAIAGAQPVTLTYYLDDPSAQTSTGAITTFQLSTANSPAIVYVRLDMEAENGNCFRVYPVTLHLISSPALTSDNLILNLGKICDNNNDGVEEYDLTQHQSQIYSGAEQYSYGYFEKYDPATGAFSIKIADPSAFPINKSTEVFVNVSKGACVSVAKIVLNFNFQPAVKIKAGNISKCDKGYDYGETYDLNDGKAAMFVSSQNGDTLADMDVTYYATQEDANLGTLKISNLQTTFYNIVTFWARFESKNTHCFSVMPIVLKTYFPPKAIPSTIEVCDSNLDGNPEVNLLRKAYTDNMVSVIDPENNFRFYITLADITNNKPIANPENFSPNPFPSQIYVLVENIAGCFTLPSTIDFTFGTALPVIKDNIPLDQCDEGNDGKETLNLSQFENEIYAAGASYSYYPTLQDLNKDTKKIATPSAYSYDNKVHPPIIFVKVEGAGFCPALVRININLKETPIFELPDYYFCPGVGIKIEPDLTYLKPKNYIWKDPSGNIITEGPNATYIDNVKTAGQYSLTIEIANGCSYTEEFNVIAYDVPIITQLIGLSATSYQVIATGSKKIVYSIDGIKWQDSNVFENIPPGRVTFYVRFEDSECLGETREGLSVKVINVITPNDDGKNDKWTFNNLDVFKDVPSTIKIYDRNGVLLYEQSSTDSFYWDGKFNGRSLPTSSYWYIMILPDKTIDGWILLKNRN